MISEVTIYYEMCGSGMREVDCRSGPIESDAPRTRFELQRRRLRALLAAEKRQPRGCAGVNRNIYRLVIKIAHDDCALSRFVSPLDSNPSLVLVEIDRGEIFAAVRKALVTFSEREQVAMELQHLMMRRR